MDPTLLLSVILGVAPWRRPAEAPPEPPPEEPAEAPVVEQPEPAPPPPPSAPPLFAAGLPVDLGDLPPGLASFSAQGCAACHGSVHESWRQSTHRGGWQDPVFFEAARATGEAPLCVSCHLPLAVQQPVQLQEYLGGDLTRALVRTNPSWDATLQQEGVTCAACHVRDGQVAGLRVSGLAPHPVAVSAELGTSAFCGTCHQLSWPGADQPFYDTFGEWERSGWATAGVRCQDCHMPPVAGAVTAGAFASHSDHRVFVERSRAVSVLVELPAKAGVRGERLTARVRVQNSGAGHAFPTGSPFKHVLLRAELLDSGGEVAGEALEHRFQREVEAAPPYLTVSDTRLAPGGEVVLEHAIELAQRSAAGLGRYRITLAVIHADGTAEEAFVVQEIPYVLD